MRIHYSTFDTPLGTVALGTSSTHVCFLHFVGDALEGETILSSLYPDSTIIRDPSHLSHLERATRRYLERSGPLGRSLTPPAVLQIGSPFQQNVWRYLQNIPLGEVRSYAQVAAGIGQPSAVRAVGTACAKNNVALLVPCHRVIRSDGNLGGFRWGLERKERLLRGEQEFG